ncbi:MAG: hypothetical protein J5521_07580 [Lachnospiraceae bacterium]|nr:hypothetical protein [Lachnospiraceae bacterium]
MEERSNVFMQVLLLNELLRSGSIDKNLYQHAINKIQAAKDKLFGSSTDVTSTTLPIAITA